MTQLEGRELAAQLTRIWAMGCVVDWFRSTDEGDSLSFGFRAMLTEDVCFTCRDNKSSPGLLFRLSAEPQEATHCRVEHLCCYSDEGEVKMVLPGSSGGRPSQRFERFSHEWMDRFRRGCWLSGCAIECSAHEQLEWMMWYQGQEESKLE